MSAKESLVWSTTLQNGLDMAPFLNIFLKTATKMSYGPYEWQADHMQSCSLYCVCNMSNSQDKHQKKNAK